MPIFKIWRWGSKEVSIEEGRSAEEACKKAGWKIEHCEVEEIPERQIIAKTTPARVRRQCFP